MDRASWLKCIEKWFHSETLVEKNTINGYPVPKDLPVLAGPLDTNSKGEKDQRSIVIYIRATEKHWHLQEEPPRLEEAWGKFIIPDHEALVLIGDKSISFIPWEAIFYIRG